MKKALTACLGACLMLALGSPSFAASVQPIGYVFTLKGGGNLSKPADIWPCGWTFQAVTTSSTGGTMTDGVGDTNPNCSWLSVNDTTWSITSDTTGVVHGMKFLENGATFCSTTRDVPFTILKSGNKLSSFFFNSVDFSNCNYNANLSAGAALTVTP